MKKIVLLSTFLLMQCMLFAQKHLMEDPNVSLRSLSGEFDKILIAGNILVVLNQSSAEALAVSAVADKYKGDIITSIQQNTLRISTTGSNARNRGRELKVYLSFKQLSEIVAAGGADIILLGELASPQFELKISGTGFFKGTLKVQNLKVNLSGASQVRLNGTVGKLDAECSGASDIDGYDLIVEEADVKASGASDINLWVNKAISAQASGASHIYYKGSAQLKNVKSSGVSEILPKNEK